VLDENHFPCFSFFQLSTLPAGSHSAILHRRVHSTFFLVLMIKGTSPPASFGKWSFIIRFVIETFFFPSLHTWAGWLLDPPFYQSTLPLSNRFCSLSNQPTKALIFFPPSLPCHTPIVFRTLFRFSFSRFRACIGHPFSLLPTFTSVS